MAVGEAPGVPQSQWGGGKAVHESFANQAKKRFLCYFRLQVKI